MMRKFHIFVCLLSILYASEACQELYYNHCKENAECCSGFCFKGDDNNWAEGVCQTPKAKAESPACQELWYNNCTADSECCSKFCFKGDDNQWEKGVCKTRDSEAKTVTESTPAPSASGCRELWYNNCTSNAECCSGICYKGDDNTWKEGVCNPKDDGSSANNVGGTEVNATIVENCLGLWSNNCTGSIDCCSGYCDKGPESMWLLGVCKSRENQGTLSAVTEDTCRATWDNHCKHGFECCSGNCFMGKDNQWEYGVCQPQQSIEEYLGTSPPLNQSGTNSSCYPMLYEGCQYDSECCESMLCERKSGLTVGTCKPMTALKIINEKNEWIECFENWYEYCTADEECCSGICEFFDDSEKPTNRSIYGVCAPNIQVIPIEIVEEILAKKYPNQTTTAVETTPTPQKKSRRKRAVDVSSKKVVCYIGSWANYKPGKGKFVIEDIDASLCTHVVYGFAKLESNKITAFDPWLDLSKKEPGGSLDAYHRFTTGLKKKNPSVKTIIAIGGWNEGSEKYSAMASSDKNRQTFADSVVKFLDKYKFDGLDIDWEYPSIRGGNARDKENLNQLLKLLRSKLKGKLLTMAVAANPRTVMSGYDVPTISGLLDYISVMSYDYHGAFDNYTGHNAPLYGRKDDEDATFNVAFGINFWLANGVPREKLIMGLPLYGRVVKLADKNKHGLMQKTVGPGDNGTLSNEAGVLYYREICPKIADDKWVKEWDSVSLVPYMYKGDQWITYDNEQSLGLKVQLAMQANLGGIMFWSLEGDDYADNCKKGKYSLLKAAKDAMSNVIEYEKEQEEQRKEEVKDKECSESAVDGIPILSQLKSLFEWMSGKSKCAKKTQENFTKKAPIISQIRSAVEAATGDLEAARKTQISFLKNLEETVESTPGVGHMVAAGYCAAGKLEKCKEVAASATRPIFAVAGGIAGGIVGGPAGAIAGGVAGATAFDGIKTGIDSAINHKYTPSGNIQSLGNLFTGKSDAGEQFDTVAGILGDALAGRGGAAGASRGGKPIGIKKEPTANNGKPRCKRASSGSCNYEFLNDLEDFGPVSGLRVVLDNSNGPPRRIQRNPNANNRVEYVEADIQRSNLQIRNEGQSGDGSGTNQGTRDFSKDMNGPIATGNEKNDAGHIIGNQLGGTGRDTSNIVPQSSHFNRGAWKTEVEGLVYELVKANGNAKYIVKPIYDSPTDTRPSSIRFKIESAGQEYTGDVLNPVIEKSEIPHLADKDYKIDLSDIEFLLKP